MKRILSKLSKKTKTALIILLAIFAQVLFAASVIWAGRELRSRSYFYDVSRSLSDLKA